MNKLIYLVNAILLFLIVRYEYTSDSDKTIIISALGVVVLLVLNLICALLSHLDKKPIYRDFYYCALGALVGLMLLFVN